MDRYFVVITPLRPESDEAASAETRARVVGPFETMDSAHEWRVSHEHGDFLCGMDCVVDLVRSEYPGCGCHE